MTFPTYAKAAAALFDAFGRGEAKLTKKAVQFLGQLVVDDSYLSEAQKGWADKLLAQNGLPPVDGGAHG